MYICLTPLIHIFLLNIIDTAGIRDTNNLVESIGVKKSLELIENSDLILYVLSNNDKISIRELEILEKKMKLNLKIEKFY